MAYKKSSITQSLAQIELSINGTLGSPAILSRIEPFGYSEDRVREGLAMYNQTKTEFMTFQIEYGEQYTAYGEMNELWGKNRETYMQILRLARVGLKNKPGVLHSLRATGTRKRSITGFMDDAQMLYNNLMKQPEFMTVMSNFGVTAEKLNDALAQLDILSEAHKKYFREKGEAQDQTVKRDLMYDKLYDWYSDFRAVLRIALTDSEQMLEKLGVVVKRK